MHTYNDFNPKVSFDYLGTWDP